MTEVPLVDLHLHSTASDGIFSPKDIVRLAKEGGLSLIALTDHDTTAGVAEAQAEGKRVGIDVVAGVEISLDFPRGTFHMIGLFIDPDDRDLIAALAELRESRDLRNRGLVERLGKIGLPVDLDEVTAHAGGEVVARPHFARAMIARGYVGTNQEAFDLYLARGRPAYVERTRLSGADAISFVHAAGGVAVLCHPFTLELNDAALLAFAREQAAEGLDAMEVIYSTRDPAREAIRRRIATEAGLLESGGSDFHGHTKKDRRAGLKARNLRIPIEVAHALRARAAKRTGH